MNLTAIILLSFCLAASAKGFSQSVTLDLRNAPLEKVFTIVEQQTGYSFIYMREQLQPAKKVTLKVQNETLENVLEKLFRDQPFTFTISGKHIAVKPKKEKKNTDNPASVVVPSDQQLIKGRIKDASGNALQRASVMNKTSKSNTLSDPEGRFSINAKAGDVIAVSYVGYLNISVRIVQGSNGTLNAIVLTAEKQPEFGIDNMSAVVVSSNRQPINSHSNNTNTEGTNIDFILLKRIESMNTVVINAGYYTIKKQEATGSISRVDAKTIGKQPVLNPMATIQGRMTGVVVQQSTGIPGGDFKIEIRGRNNLRSEGNEPLYIIDGVPFSSEKVSSEKNTSGIFFNSSSRPGASPLNGINNADIESIEILKDADATAIYGSRGANGVVLITTKKGKTGKTKFSLDAYYGAGKTRTLPLLNTEEYLAMRKQAFANDGISTYPSDAYDVNGTWDQSRYTDWQKVLIGGTANSASIQSSLSGGTEGTQFLFSAGYRREGSVFPGKLFFTKGSSHFSLNHLSPAKKLSLSLSLTGNIDQNNQISSSYATLAKGLAPNAPALYNADGSLNWENSTWKNPLSNLLRTYRSDVNSFVSNAIIGYVILPGLQIKSSFGFTQVQSKEKTLSPSTWFDPALNQTSKSSAVIVSNGTNRSWIIEPQINYEKNIGPGKLTALLGTTFQQQQFDKTSDQYLNFPSNSLLNNLPTAASKTSFEFIKNVYRYSALFGRINYNIDKKYIINITGRRDGSSRFGPGRQFANFGAIGAAWIFTKEKWLENISLLSFGKLRASYGTTGNDQIPNYYFLDTYSATTSYNGITGLNPSRLFNPVFGWETNKKMEMAIDLSFFNDLISLSAGYYRNRSSNQLVNYTLPMTTGFNGILSNFPATIQNTGLELELNTINLQNKHTRWTSSFNITIPKNRLIAFPGIETSTYANSYIVGQSIYIKKFYETTGVDPITGLYTFKDYNNDGKITSPDDDKKVLLVGQELYGGFNNSITYKNWSIDLFFQFVKQTGYNYKYADAGAYPGSFVNQPALILEESRWQKPGDQSSIQRLATEKNAAAFNASIIYQSSDGTVSDASFIRFKNLSVNYQFPVKWINGMNCRAYVQGQNLFVITAYKGYDPESQVGSLAPLKILTAGIQISL